MLAPMITVQTVGQLAAGVESPIAEAVGPIAGFVVLAAGAAWFFITIARHITEDPP